MRKFFVRKTNGQITASGRGTPMTPTYSVAMELCQLCGGNVIGPIHTTPNTLRWLEENHGLFGMPCGRDWDHQKEIIYMGYRIIFDSGEDGIMYFDEDHD
jgi:hypothetical protein